MIVTILGIVASVLTLAIGIYRWIKRMKKHARKMAEEGKAKIDKANSADGSTSDFLDGFGKLRRK